MCNGKRYNNCNTILKLFSPHLGLALHFKPLSRLQPSLQVVCPPVGCRDLRLSFRNLRAKHHVALAKRAQMCHLSKELVVFRLGGDGRCWSLSTFIARVTK